MAVSDDLKAYIARRIEGFLYPDITRESFERIRTDGGTRRVCFATTHRDEPRLKAGPDYVGTLNLPFCQSVGPAFERALGVELKPGGRPGAWWRPIRSEEEFERVKAWVQAQGTRVFLRDCLTSSIALDLNLVEADGAPDGHTLLGELESRAKTERDEDALTALTDAFCDAIRDLPRYREAALIAAVPPRPGKPYDLPQTLAERIAAALSITDVTSRFAFAAAKGTVKTAAVEAKWAEWEKSGLSFAPPLIGRPAVILIDDKYQSGTSINFVASRLREAGAGDILGLCAVKTWRDTDNA
jgi:hypothetical protein